ncbi:hypothetical protein NLU13_7187 [Sarocladium strictum]|uniref:NADP-dependent oxidoreductase domain-containing protein n=1 Tax=Sarocladium strictum TaxID=5046 RepID=A0AA39L5K6_SARSR|nr:hypothetical protein NLU13_7187 [Sarocladium strictum]
MDKVLQTGLSAGMAATAGFHHVKPKPVDKFYSGKNVQPPSFEPNTRTRVSYKTVGEPVEASQICIGAWPWGDKATWNWKEEDLPAAKQAWDYLYQAGINFIDTAEAYGDGRSEEIVGQFVRDLPRESFVIQTKYIGTAAGINNYIHPVEAPVKSLKGSLGRLGLEYVDIYLVHGPIHPQSIANVAKGMAECVEKRLTRAVGVANYEPRDVEKIQAELRKYKIPLASNQCEYNILRRYPELHDGIATCERNGLVFQSYSSLAQGRLTGKYSPGNPPPKSYRFSNYDMKDVEPVLQVLQRISVERGKSVGAVALNWNISKGVTPLVGVRNKDQAVEAVEALGWRLSSDEMAEIDDVSFEGEKTRLWQQG